jgi:hypothetical protein
MMKRSFIDVFLIIFVIGTVAVISTRYLHVPTVLLTVINGKLFLSRSDINIAPLKFNGPMMLMSYGFEPHNL